MAKTSAFIGAAGPFGYDYKNGTEKVHEMDYSSPNPVLENVLGLLLCYDEIVFLSRHFCPVDMRDLPYVKFVTDDEKALPVAAASLLEFDAAQQGPDWGADFKDFRRISQAMTGPNEALFNIDNHTHALSIGTWRSSANGMRLDHALRDLSVVAALGLQRTDVIINSPAQQGLTAVLEKELRDGQYFNQSTRAAATQLAMLQVPNFLGPTGSYHESLEELRALPGVSEFRQFLLEQDAPYSDGQKIADEISKVAFDFNEQITGKFFKKRHVFRSIGIPALKGALNQVVPGLGSLAAAGVEAPNRIKENQFREQSRWAPFVVSLHRPRRA